MKKTIIPPIPSPRVYSRASIVNHVHAEGHTRNIWWLVKSNVCTCVCVCVLSSTIRLQFPAGTRRLLLLYLNMGAGISY